MKAADLWLACRFAWRELRAGLRGLRILLACLALGVAAIAAVGTLAAGIRAGLAADGAKLLGGDLELRGGNRPLPPEARAWAETRGATAAAVTTLRAMLVAPSAERLLVELKAVEAAYPLYGALVLEPAVVLGAGDVAVEPAVAERLDLAIGDTVRIGEARLRVAALIRAEPDKVATPAVFGPRALIGGEALAATALIQPGSLISYDLRLRLPAGTDAGRFAANLAAASPAGAFRIRNAAAAEPGVARFLDRAASFLTLAALTALLVGGIGVATATRAWLDARARSIATLRCLGAAPAIVFAACLVQILAVAALGIVIGLIAGVGLAATAVALLGDALPVPPRLALDPAPLALAAWFGLLTALVFALGPLGRAARISGAALFRDGVQPDAAGAPRAVQAVVAALGLLLAGSIIGTAEQPGFAAAFCAAAVATLALFRLGGLGLMALARRASGVRAPLLRLGLANLHRPGAPTVLTVIALGVGLTTLTAIATIEGNLRASIAGETATNAPNFFFVDIQPDQVARFDALFGQGELQRVPSLRARVVAVAGVPVEQARTTPETAWALTGDRGLTYAAALPAGTRLAAGAWWPADYRGVPLLSFDAGLARGWGVGVGDHITVNVLGRDFDLTIANLRDVAWRSLGMNFTLVASPGFLEAAPHTHIATWRGDPAAEAALQRAVSDAFPNVSVLRVRDALAGVAALLGRIGTALAAVAAVTLVAGVLVLAGAIAAGQRQRVRDAVVLKTVGATSAQIRTAWLIEFGLAGLVAGTLAALVGTAAAWAVLRFAMQTPWTPMPGTLAATVLGCIGLALLLGQIGTERALRIPAARVLREA